MKVLFINPHYPMRPETVLLHPPLGYAYMATELNRHGHEVQVLDLPMRENSPYVEAGFIEAYNPDLIGITCVTQSYCQALEIASFTKLILPLTPVVLGGPHVTFTPEDTLARHRAIDFVLMFDCDFSLASLADALAARDPRELAKVPGLAFRSSDDGGIVVTAPDAAILELDRMPLPDRRIFDMRAYLRRDYETVLMTARGCPSRCSFCSTTQMGRRYRFHGVQHVVDEFEELLDFGFTSFFIGDDTFAAHPKRTIEICDEICRRGLRFEWTSNMRVLDARPEVLDAMAAAGAYRVFTGLETIKLESLQIIRKGTTPELIFKALERIAAAGLQVHTAYIIGVPGDTEDDVLATLDFIKRVRPTVATFNTIEVRPGTEMFLQPERFGLSVPDPYWFETTSWMDLPTCSTQTLSQADIKRLVEHCYFEFCHAMFSSPDEIHVVPHHIQESATMAGADRS